MNIPHPQAAAADVDQPEHESAESNKIFAGAEIDEARGRRLYYIGMTGFLSGFARDKVRTSAASGTERASPGAQADGGAA